MKRIVLDTSAYSNLQRGLGNVASLFDNSEIVYIPHQVEAELLSGFRLGAQEKKNRKKYFKFVLSRKVHVLLSNQTTTDYVVDIITHARKVGVSIGDNDVWIAALTRQLDATLVTFDKDFEHLGYKPLRLKCLVP